MPERSALLDGACDEVLWMDQNGHMRYRSKDRDAMMPDRVPPSPVPAPAPRPSPSSTPTPAPMPARGGGIPIRSGRTTPIPDRFARRLASEGQLGFAGFGRSRPAQRRLFDPPSAEPTGLGTSDCGAGSPGDPGFEFRNTCWERRGGRGSNASPGAPGSPTPTVPTPPATPITPRRVTGRRSLAAQAMAHPDVQQPMNHWLGAKRLLTWMSDQGPITSDKQYRDVKAALGREQTHRQLAERAMQRAGVAEPGLGWRPAERAQVDRLFENLRQYEAGVGEQREAQQRAADYWKPQSSVRSTLGQARMVRENVPGAKEAFPGAAAIAGEVARRVHERRKVEAREEQLGHQNPFVAMGFPESIAADFHDQAIGRELALREHNLGKREQIHQGLRHEPYHGFTRHMGKAPAGSLEHAAVQRAMVHAESYATKGGKPRHREDVRRELHRERQRHDQEFRKLLWDHRIGASNKATLIPKMREHFLMARAFEYLARFGR